MLGRGLHELEGRVRAWLFTFIAAVTIPGFGDAHACSPTDWRGGAIRFEHFGVAAFENGGLCEVSAFAVFAAVLLLSILELYVEVTPHNLRGIRAGVLELDMPSGG